MLEQKSIIIALAVFLILAFTMIHKSRIVITVSSRKHTELNYIFLLFLFWILAVCIKDSADLSNYRWAYDGGISHGKEPFFDIVQIYFRGIGWSFDSFKLLWVSIISVLLYTGVKKYCDVPGKVIALALLTILTGFVTQMRSALVGAIFLNAFSLLFTGRKRDKIIYCIIIVLAAQIHIVGYCFLLLAIINKKESRSFKKVYYIAIAIITLVALFSSSFASTYINSFISIFSNGGASVSRALSYFSGETSHFRYEFFLLCKHLFLFYLTNIACDIQIKETETITEKKQQINMIRETNTLMLVFLPITMISASFERLFYVFALIQYGIIFNVDNHNIILFGRLSWKQSIQSILVIGVLFIAFVELYFSPDDMVRILNSIEWSF